MAKFIPTYFYSDHDTNIQLHLTGSNQNSTNLIATDDFNYYGIILDKISFQKIDLSKSNISSYKDYMKRIHNSLGSRNYIIRRPK